MYINHYIEVPRWKARPWQVLHGGRFCCRARGQCPGEARGSLSGLMAIRHTVFQLACRILSHWAASASDVLANILKHWVTLSEVWQDRSRQLQILEPWCSVYFPWNVDPQQTKIRVFGSSTRKKKPRLQDSKSVTTLKPEELQELTAPSLARSEAGGWCKMCIGWWKILSKWTCKWKTHGISEEHRRTWCSFPEDWHMGCYSLQVVLAVQKDLSAFNFSMDTNDATWQQVFFCTWIPCDSSHFAGSPVVIVFILYSVYIILYIYMIYIYICIYNHTHMYIYIYLVITVESSWDLLSPLRQRHPAPVGTQPRQTIPGRNAWVATIFRRPQACCACDVPFCNPTCQ